MVIKIKIIVKLIKLKLNICNKYIKLVTILKYDKLITRQIELRMVHYLTFFNKGSVCIYGLRRLSDNLVPLLGVWGSCLVG